MTIPIIDSADFLEKIQAVKNPFVQEYYAFYSSWFGGIIRDPSLMLLPIDDHIVHRGDGVFEVFKAVEGAIYLLDEHLQRLFRSASSIAIKPRFDYEQIKDIVFATLRAANQSTALIRVFLSRGPGDFSVNPYDPVDPQLYVMITKLKPPKPEAYENGVKIGLSQFSAKPSWMASIKSCNYLPNVLMKKEALDRNLDYVIATDSAGNLTESATENLSIVDHSGKLIHPNFDIILKGTTMIRTFELAQQNNIPTAIRSITLSDLQAAQEVIITGTSLNVLPVVAFENIPIANGKPGPIAQQLNQLIQADIKSGPHRTVF